MTDDFYGQLDIFVQPGKGELEDMQTQLAEMQEFTSTRVLSPFGGVVMGSGAVAVLAGGSAGLLAATENLDTTSIMIDTFVNDLG